MNYLNGGYVMIDKADSNIYAKALGALNAGKPILWYENSTTCYYIDTLTKSGDDIVLTKGGKTITITDANVVTEKGEIQNHLYAYKFDSSSLTLDSGSVSLNKYYTFVTSLNIEKISDLPKGTYLVTSGSITINSDELVIDYIEIDDYGYTFYLANDNDISFTIDTDDNYNNKVTIF